MLNHDQHHSKDSGQSCGRITSYYKDRINYRLLAKMRAENLVRMSYSAGTEAKWSDNDTEFFSRHFLSGLLAAYMLCG